LDEEVELVQRAVQMILGRCLLRIQQYERVMKALAAHHEFEGDADSLSHIQSERIDRLSDKSLGQLIQVLERSFLVITQPGDPPYQDSADDDDKPAAWFRFRSTLGMTAERYVKTIAQLHKVRDLRNDLVHHLIEDFDVWTVPGGLDACAYLEESYEEIDRSFAELLAWAKSVDQARESSAGLMVSGRWEQFAATASDSPTQKDEAICAIVARLQEAELALAVDGWADLDAAIDYINQRSREHFPKRYGCSSWQGLLRRSGAFEVVKVAPIKGKGVTRFRSLTQSGAEPQNAQSSQARE
jgi:hypothetical protein